MKIYNLLLLACLATCTNSNAQIIHTEPVDAYWKMVEPLKMGDSLSREAWKIFLEIEANHVYIENQGFDSSYLENLRKNIQYVYMPKYDSLLQARLLKIEKDPGAYWLTYKVYQYKKNELQLKAYQLKLEQRGYLDTAYSNTWQWLPANLHRRDSTVNIYFLGIENDAIAGGHLIICTLWSAYVQDQVKMGILIGHEMHHVLRQSLNYEKAPLPEKGILYVLDKMLNEGSADMVDKPYGIMKDDELPVGSQYKEFLLFQADSIVKQIDSSLQEYSNSSGKNYKTEKQYRDLIRWTSGHCPGFYMADIIVRNGYKKQLIKNIENPFYFIYLYNLAASIDKQHPPMFSKTSIKLIRKLEHQYMPTTKLISNKH